MSDVSTRLFRSLALASLTLVANAAPTNAGVLHEGLTADFPREGRGESFHSPRSAPGDPGVCTIRYDRPGGSLGQFDETAPTNPSSEDREGTKPRGDFAWRLGFNGSGWNLTSNQHGMAGADGFAFGSSGGSPGPGSFGGPVTDPSPFGFPPTSDPPGGTVPGQPGPGPDGPGNGPGPDGPGPDGPPPPDDPGPSANTTSTPEPSSLLIAAVTGALFGGWSFVGPRLRRRPE